ncbi:hypothetical protein Hypma_013042 [Hypsizygus marmoreus]|uniref:Uncharacterized protein n=1 Tax=Hypsizygus marmoreus TaxID=39966 RepID=A0A369JFV6_HYPMA|nr:hypothetical protein Hypma_013042 [Hypsizygus marmoreus]
MNGLSRTLQWLKLPKKHSSCHIIVTPDPRKYPGFKRVRTGQHQFYLKFESVLNMDQYISYNPYFVVASNGGSPTLSRPLKSSNQPKGSEWIGIVDTSQKTPHSKTLREVLVDILDKFPNYELHSEKGVSEAIGDIEASLNPIATFEEAKDHGL